MAETRQPAPNTSGDAGADALTTLALLDDMRNAGFVDLETPDVGAKTMLDALVPLHEAMVAGADASAARQAVDEAVAATLPMRATKGRAAFLGERSIGHVDPGARSPFGAFRTHPRREFGAIVDPAPARLGPSQV